MALAQEAPADARADAIGVVDPGFRFALPGIGSEREFRIWLVIVTLVYLLGIVGMVTADYAGLLEPVPPDQREQRGQIEGPPSLDVEIVEAPALDAKTKQSRAGLEAPPQPMNDKPPELQPTLPPEEMQQKTPPSPSEPKAEEVPPEKPAEKAAEAAEKPPERAPEKPADKQPVREQFAVPDKALDGIDVSMKRYVEALDAAAAQRQKNREHEQRQSQRTQTTVLGGASRIQGRAKSGRTDAYGQSVIAALLKTKPPPFALRGSVMVSFEISQSGGLKYVKVLHSSGNTAMDQEAINAIRRAQFEPPPAGYDPADLTYIIHYIFD